MRNARTTMVAGGFLAFTGLSLLAAWLNIQAVRWGYKNQRLGARWEELKKSEQSLDRRLHESFSLDRLDRTARERFKLKVPSPGQVVLVGSPAEAAG